MGPRRVALTFADPARSAKIVAEGLVKQYGSVNALSGLDYAYPRERFSGSSLAISRYRKAASR
jgi:hypothetical protein